MLPNVSTSLYSNISRLIVGQCLIFNVVAQLQRKVAAANFKIIFTVTAVLLPSNIKSSFNDSGCLFFLK